MTLTEWLHQICDRYGEKLVADWGDIDRTTLNKAKNGENGKIIQAIDKIMKRLGATIVSDESDKDLKTTIRTLARLYDEQCKDE